MSSSCYTPAAYFSTGIDLVVEIFVMDAVSGITPFALCDVTIIAIGSKISNSSGGALTPASVPINNLLNPNFGTFYDRAIIDFGNVTNSDTYSSGQTDYTDSTISITFTATLVINSNYNNNTVVVTAGAEYDSQNMVWVSQETHNFSMTAGSYVQSIQMSSPTTLAQYSGGSFSIDAYLTNPFDTLTFEVYTNQDLYDQFTISQMFILSKGSNFVCMLDSMITTTYYDSASGRTVQRATLIAPLIIKNLDYTALTAALTNSNFLMQLGFNIFLVDAKAGDVVNVGVGLIIGVTTIWTGNVTITVTAGSIPVSATPTWSAVNPVTTTAVANGGTATWGFTLTIPSSQDVLVDCSAVPGSGATVCSFAYGSVGVNIANIPNIENLLINGSDGSMKFTEDFNSTGTFTIAGANDITFEVSVQYSGTARPSTTLTCSGGLSATLAATSGTGNISDMTGTVSQLITSDINWYSGSQAGLSVNLTFPAGGTPYQSLVLESAGDLSVSGWGARACEVRILSAGKAVPCIAGFTDDINAQTLMYLAKNDSVFNDGMRLPMGPACGTNRLTTGKPSDYKVSIRVVYYMPTPQPTAVAGRFNLSVGISLASNLIWTGWDSFTYTTAAPTSPTVVFTVAPSSVPIASIMPGVPQVIKVVLKTPPGSVGQYSIVFTVNSVSTISLCKILILDIGSNYACLDKNPYFKETIPFQPNTIIHSPVNWGLQATVNFGILRNLGTGTMYPGNVGDVNSIVLGVVLKGVAGGTGVLTATLTGFPNPPATASLTVSSVMPDLGGNIVVTAQGVDGTGNAYDGVMKLVNFNLTVPAGYGKEVTATITNNAASVFTICFAAVIFAGQNLPCLIPPQVISNLTVNTATQQVMSVQFGSVCYRQFTNNSFDDVAVLQVGVMFLPSMGSTATLSLALTENSVVAAPVTFTVTKLSTAYSPGFINTTGMMLGLINNGTYTVTPGLRTWIGVTFTIPKGVTTDVEVGVMTPSDSGRAYATVHGFRFVPGLASRNLGCLLQNCSLYKPSIIQNSSLSMPMIHPSQTDTLTSSLLYITNTGLSYYQHSYQVQDDQLWIEADIWIADHPNATNGATINIHFAIKAADKIFVITVPLTLDKTATQVMSVVTNIFLTDNTTTLFSQGERVELTLQAYHVVNVSTLEANTAAVRILMPKYLGFVPGLDSCTGNITGNLTTSGYIDYEIGYLFFTDILELNCTLTIDPNNTLPKGLGIVNATTIMRLVCSTSLNAALKYCGNTSYVGYQMNGEDCTNPLGMATMSACQLTASSAIDSTTGPLMAVPGSGSGWSPPVRAGATWSDYYTIDFLKDTRVTRIVLEAVTGTLSISSFKMQYSQNGYIFVDTCEGIVINVPTSGIVDLPSECRFQARYGRLVILSVSSGLGTAAVPTGTTPVGVRFTDWYGCYLQNTTNTCTGQLSTILSTDVTKWRHAAYDSVNKFLYFCDVSLDGTHLLCFCTPDGVTWNAMPSYIGGLVGFDTTTSMMYAMDTKWVAMVGSIDCVNWSIVSAADQAKINASATPPTSIPGKPAATLGSVIIGPWTADFTGLQLGGQYMAKWANCCS
ncbi:uncharacterized protein [Cherax quadricarinatus]|uniref:uncharacterized protein isoform X2 n=1 Tax=Cherax quadricarinatus TaxID=27406 RepID=UPI00387E8573